VRRTSRTHRTYITIWTYWTRLASAAGRWSLSNNTMTYASFSIWFGLTSPSPHPTPRIFSQTCMYDSGWFSYILFSTSISPAYIYVAWRHLFPRLCHQSHVLSDTLCHWRPTVIHSYSMCAFTWRVQADAF
jgi:hypothetical protein